MVWAQELSVEKYTFVIFFVLNMLKRFFGNGLDRKHKGIRGIFSIKKIGTVVVF